MRTSSLVLREAEAMLGPVQPCTGEPPRARHLTRLEHTVVRGGCLDIVVVPDRLPEGLQVGHGPAPQRAVVGELQPAVLAKPGEVCRELGLLAQRLVGQVEDVAGPPAGEEVVTGIGALLVGSRT